jgi:hypothetical protein
MQKSLELMNIKVHTVINDITGKTGTAIIEAIIDGEREPQKFMPYVDKRIKADKQTLLKSLEGNWRKEHLATLKLSYELYKILQQKIVECEKQIEQTLSEYPFEAKAEGNDEQTKLAIEKDDGINKTVKKNSFLKNKRKNKQKTKSSPVFDVDIYLQRIYQVDVTQIYGISQTAALEILAETGKDLRQWESERMWVSWLNLCPHNKKSGGKLISSTRLKKKPNLATQAFRSAANSLSRSDHWLGDYFRRMRAKGGHKYAIVATARKLAIIYYRMIKYKEEFNPVDLKEYQNQFKAAKISYLERKLAQLKAA